MPFENVLPHIRQRMSRIRKVNSKPEMIVRRTVHRLGYRFRLHRRALPGTPDLVFPSLRKVVFVHGCFWHQHDCALGNKQPFHRREYWIPKLARNRQRDICDQAVLRNLGFSVLVIWECETRDHQSLEKTLISFLKS